MVVYFATVVRSAPIAQSGELVKVDWPSKRVVARHPLVPVNPDIHHDPNPRGGTRGGRGVLVNGNEVIAASYHSLHVFDRNLKPLRQISHPLFSNLHELAWDGAAMWVTSTGVDAAIKVDHSGRVLESWFAREDPRVASHFQLPTFNIAKTDDVRLKFLDCPAGSEASPDQTHLNAAAMQESRPLMLLNRFGSVVRLNPTEVLVEDSTMKGCHNVRVTRCGHVLVNDSHHMTVRVYDARGKLVKRLNLAEYGPVRQILQRASLTRVTEWLRTRGRPRRLMQALFPKPAVVKPIWVRGLFETPTGTLLVGISPASVLEIDWHTGQLKDFFSFSTDLRVCIHGLVCA